MSFEETVDIAARVGTAITEARAAGLAGFAVALDRASAERLVALVRERLPIRSLRGRLTFVTDVEGLVGDLAVLLTEAVRLTEVEGEGVDVLTPDLRNGVQLDLSEGAGATLEYTVEVWGPDWYVPGPPWEPRVRRPRLPRTMDGMAPPLHPPPGGGRAEGGADVTDRMPPGLL